MELQSHYITQIPNTNSLLRPSLREKISIISAQTIKKTVSCTSVNSVFIIFYVFLLIGYLYGSVSRWDSLIQDLLNPQTLSSWEQHLMPLG